MTLDELIKKLPDEMQPLAKEYAETLIVMSEDSIAAFVQACLMSDWDAAYANLARSMTTADLVKVQRRVANDIEFANHRAATLDDIQAELVEAALTIGLNLLSHAVAKATGGEEVTHG